MDPPFRQISATFPVYPGRNLKPLAGPRHQGVGDVKRLLLKFRSEEDGAVTVDWVVMTAMAVGLAITVISIFHDGPRSIGDSISSRLAQMSAE